MSLLQADRADEQVFRDPAWVAGQGFLHSNNVLFYFATSPFFDQTSNNSTVFQQCSRNPEMMNNVLGNRKSFEDRLRKMSGIEYVVKCDPIESQVFLESANGPEVSNIWVIHKQERRKRPHAEDEVNLLAVYYIVGDSIFMAPSVQKVVNNRMLSAVASLKKALSATSELSTFTPALGHTYTTSVSSAVIARQPPSQQVSKESTPAPDGVPLPSRSADTAASRTLLEAYAMSLRYSDEYMDDQPLIGEPGNFLLAKSGAKAGVAKNTTSRPGPVTERTPAPSIPGLQTDIAPTPPKYAKDGESSPLSAKEKPKRRKSKPVATPIE